MRKTKQSTTKNIMVFMTDLTDHISGKAGLTLTITASKDGGAFGSVTPSVTERGSGWYNLALTAAHIGTLGDLAVHITSAGADPTDLVLEVVAYDPNDAAGLGLSRIDALISSRAAPGAEMALIDGAITVAKAPNLDAAISSRTAPGAEMALIDGAITVAKAPNLDAAITTRALESGGNVATIMGKTNNLPPDPADASDIATAFGAVPGAVWVNATRTLTTIIGVNKNAALNAFEFLMVDSSGDPKTGLTVTAERSIDGGAFAACANAVAEVGSGVYKINLAATDLNGDVITIKFTATGAKQTTITIKTAG